MADKPMINIVSTRCQPKDVEKFNKWYNEVHIPMLLKFKGLKGAARYKVIGDSADAPRFIALYKFGSAKDFEEFQKSPELAAAIKEMGESWGNNVELTSRIQYELIKEW
ncbi:MAG: hypothetical protein H6Q39_726 [Chloroflexi bacterium]|jgi:uncharacterized protein (TIGR02118 family)|nr:hypothetical protein [Chloroflexota bacterium]